MRMTRTRKTPADRRGFTTVELMIVIVIIAILVAIGTAAYSRMMFEAQKRTVGEHLRTVAGAIQLCYEQYRDYPAMRFADLGLAGPVRPTSSAQPDANGTRGARPARSSRRHPFQHRKRITGGLTP